LSSILELSFRRNKIKKVVQSCGRAVAQFLKKQAGIMASGVICKRVLRFCSSAVLQFMEKYSGIIVQEE
jgi:lipoate synthase